MKLIKLFTKQNAEKPKQALVQMRKTIENDFTFYSVWIWDKCYWKFVHGSSREDQIRQLYEAHKSHMAVDKNIIIEQWP